MREHRGSVSVRSIFLAFALSASTLGSVGAAEPLTPLLRSRQSGPWSAAGTWEGGAVPGAGARVQILEGHRVLYDIQAQVAVRSLHIAGTLSFARDRDTLLEVGLIKIQAGTDASENGFDCTAHVAPPADGKPRPALEVGTPEQPLPAERRAVIRLKYFLGMDKETCPAIVCCGGRMDFHGAPIGRTWVKLDHIASAGEPRIRVAGPLTGWKAGDRIIIAGTTRQMCFLGTRLIPTTDSLRSKASTEERLITKFQVYGNGGVTEPVEAMSNRQILFLDKPLQWEHKVTGDYRAEVANLSRNVVVESSDPAGVRGHTMYHKHSAGSISYAEFRHLGKEGVLGKYPIHYHLCGDTMRGSSVIGASIWNSGNRWVTIHGTQYLVVRDCVGYDSIGHGFFLEDGTETFNVLDHNLAVMACRGKPLPNQVLKYDGNLGSGFWWANSLNTFTRNAAAECDEEGFRFEVVKSPEFNPELLVPFANGERRKTDVRTLPFVRFEDNEAHNQRLFAFNLGGFTTTTSGKPFSDVGGVGPDANHPFVIRNFRVWNSHWGFHTSCPNVRFEGAEFFQCQYGIFNSILDGHDHKRVRYVETETTMSPPRHSSSSPNNELRAYEGTSPRQKDDLPPSTVVTHVRVLAPGVVQLRGTTSDNYDVKRVLVNDIPVTATRPNFAEWTILLTNLTGAEVTITARAEDAAGNVEPRPHLLVVPLRAATAVGAVPGGVQP